MQTSSKTEPTVHVPHDAPPSNEVVQLRADAKSLEEKLSGQITKANSRIDQFEASTNEMMKVLGDVAAMRNELKRAVESSSQAQ